jgi:predicted transcriptional regulator
MSIDPSTKRLFWFIFANSKGGFNRIRIIGSLQTNPQNANQLSKELNMDYKTIQHHISVLEKNNMISKIGDYGAQYFLTDYFEHYKQVFDEVCQKIGVKQIT